MIKLLYEKEKTLEFRLTKNPMTRPQQSPEPLGFKVDDLDPNEPDTAEKISKTKNHFNYSETELVLLKKGVNTFENEEHAEYLYYTLGNPVSGGTVPLGHGQVASVENNNVIHEVEEVEEKDTEGKKKLVLKKVEGKLFKKYRLATGAQINQVLNPSAFKLPEEAK